MANRSDSADESDSDPATSRETASDPELDSNRDTVDDQADSDRKETADQHDPPSDGEESGKESLSEEELLELSRTHPILLFDGVCNLCNRWIQFVIERDPEATFRFAPLQSSIADDLLDAAGYEGETLDSVVLVDDGDYYAKSGAVIRTARQLGGIYRLLGPFGYVPCRIRDFFYDFVATRRYGWFGKREQCMMPSPDIRERFLAGGPGGESS